MDVLTTGANPEGEAPEEVSISAAAEARAASSFSDFLMAETGSKEVSDLLFFPSLGSFPLPFPLALPLFRLAEA